MLPDPHGRIQHLDRLYDRDFTLDHELREAGKMAGTASRSVRNLFGTTRRRRVAAIVVVVVVAAGLATLASGVGQRLLDPGGTPAAAAPGPGVPPGFTEFRSAEAGFAVSYPAGWRRLPSEDPQVALLAARGPEVSFLVRVAELDVAIGPQELPAAKQLTDQIVTANESVELLAEPQAIELAGLPGYFYFYSFQDSGTGQRGAHSHLFVFKGQTLITLVFQTLPAEQFSAAAPTFDQITGSFRVLEK
jgi:hypothetical protein